jgi:protein involved in polysaccharide export with SLBB domain
MKKTISLFLASCLFVSLAPNITLAQYLSGSDVDIVLGEGGRHFVDDAAIRKEYKLTGEEVDYFGSDAELNKKHKLSDKKADYFVSNAVIEKEYKLGPGDQIAVNIIVGNNDMSLFYDFEIGPDGKIFFPNVGELDLLGLTIPEAKSLINSKVSKVFKEKYVLSFRLVDPRRVQIYLSGSENKPLYIGESKYVYVYGEVAKSGRFEYLPGKKFSDYISYAGGPTARAYLSGATITRNHQKFRIDGTDVIFNGNSFNDMEIMPGDVINIPGNFFYFSDFSSFANTVLLALTLYSAVIR